MEGGFLLQSHKEAMVKIGLEGAKFRHASLPRPFPLHHPLPGEYPLDQVIYHCPTCGNLLEVVHDMEALQQRSAAEWKKLFEDRYMRTDWPHGSGCGAT